MEDVKKLLKEGVYKFTDSGNGWVYMSIPKDHVKELFAGVGVTIVDPLGEPSDDYCEGDVQFSFDCDDNLNEIIIFPVFEEEDGYVNGEVFIPAPVEFFELKEEALKELSQDSERKEVAS